MNETPNLNLTEFSEEFKSGPVRILQFKTAELALFSYLLLSGGEAVLVDPVFDVQAYRKAIAEQGCQLKYILLTHYSSEYITGRSEFEKVDVIMGSRAKQHGLAFEVHTPSEALQVGQVRLQALPTPGHTIESTSFLVLASDNKQLFAFTGDSLVMGNVGRPDMAVPTESSKEELAELTADSLERFRSLEPTCIVLPGRFPAMIFRKVVPIQSSTTIGAELKDNPLFQFASKEDLVKKILSEVPTPPPHQFHIASRNIFGHKLCASNEEPLLTIEQWKNFTNINCAIIDTRSDNEHLKKGYIKQAYLLPEGGMLSAWIGTMFEPSTELLVFAEKEKVH